MAKVVHGTEAAEALKKQREDHNQHKQTQTKTSTKTQTTKTPTKTQQTKTPTKKSTAAPAAVVPVKRCVWCDKRPVATDVRSTKYCKECFVRESFPCYRNIMDLGCKRTTMQTWRPQDYGQYPEGYDPSEEPDMYVLCTTCHHRRRLYCETCSEEVISLTWIESTSDDPSDAPIVYCLDCIDDAPAETLKSNGARAHGGGGGGTVQTAKPLPSPPPPSPSVPPTVAHHGIVPMLNGVPASSITTAAAAATLSAAAITTGVATAASRLQQAVDSKKQLEDAQAKANDDLAVTMSAMVTHLVDATIGVVRQAIRPFNIHQPLPICPCPLLNGSRQMLLRRSSVSTAPTVVSPAIVAMIRELDLIQGRCACGGGATTGVAAPTSPLTTPVTVVSPIDRPAAITLSARPITATTTATATSPAPIASLGIATPTAAIATS